ncbi:MAG TPA: hypothetical protein VJ964_02925, partial [Balneolaceae bacterium]|nr:hypothetical protein [Balneolaceae bacterium]
MFGNKEYLGLALQDDIIRVARMRIDGKKLKLVKLDRFSLVEKIKTDYQSEAMEDNDQEVSFEDEDA